MLRAFCLVGTALLALATVASADIIQLKDGRFIDGVKMSRDGDCIAIHYKNGTVKVPLDQIDDYVIEGIPPFEPRTKEEKEKRAEGLVPFRGRWVKPDVREREIGKEIAEKRDAIEDYRKHQNWKTPYEFSTKHFEIKSTLPPDVNEEVAAILEEFFDQFRKLWKVSIPKDWGKLVVYFHYDRKTFQDRSGAPPGALAYYKFVAPREIHFFYDGRDPDDKIRVLFHEVNHYLCDLMDERFHHPHWVNEAMAEYYGGSVWDREKKKLHVGLVQEGRLVEVLADMDKGKFLTVSDLISSEGRDYEHYYWGWSFVHFLMNHKKYAKRFRKFFSDIARAKDVKRRPYQWNFTTVSGAESQRVFMNRLGIKNLKALQEEWYEYVKGLDYSMLKGLEQAGVQAFRQGRVKFRAPRLLKEAIDKGSKKAAVYMHYARCLEIKDQRDEALKVVEKACEVDPLEGELWAYRGLLLIRMDRKEEGLKFIELAKEISPDDDFLTVEIALKLEELEGGD